MSFEGNDFTVYRENEFITKSLSDGSRRVYCDLGDASVLWSDPGMQRNSRMVYRRENVWSTSDGACYILAGGVLSCSDGRLWPGVPGHDVADMIVKADF